MKVDVLIVGGGPAGLSAALVLGRCHRSVLLCDDGAARNKASHAIHGLLGQEGVRPTDFLEHARRELGRYPSISAITTRVSEIRPTNGAFEFACENGQTGTASKLLLASGLVDELPNIDGIAQFYGTSVHHCLYCDGFEYAGKQVAAYGKGDKGADLAIMMKHWVSDVVVCTDGTEISGETSRKLEQHGISVRSEPVKTLAGNDGRIAEIVFESGLPLLCEGLFFATGCHQASELSERLGCKRDEKGGVIINPKTEESSVPGVYIAGDASRDVLMVAVAIAEGAKAAVAINKAFLRKDGLCD